MPADRSTTAAKRVERARALHARAFDASRAGRPAAAERLLRSALRSLSDTSGTREGLTVRTQTLITLAKVESELRGIEAGLARLDEASLLLSAGPDDVVLTAFHNQRGALFARAGRFDEAIDCFNAAEKQFAAASDRDRVAVLLNRSTARMMTGQLRAAASDLERCAAAAEETGLDAMREMSLHNLGYLRFLFGDLPGALAAMDEALRRSTENSGVSLLDRARVLVEAGLVREADDTLAEAGAIVRADRLTQDLGEIEIERARCALISGDISAARRLAGAARDRFRRRGSDNWKRAAELVLLQSDLAAGRPGKRLLEPALRLRAEFDEIGLTVQSRTASLIAGEAALSAGDVRAASELVATAGPPRRTDSITTKLHARYVRAALHRSKGEVAKASRQARAGLADLATYQATFGSIDAQTAVAVHGRRLADLDLAIALSSGRPDSVLHAAELARAVSHRLPIVRPPADRETADLLAELRQIAEASNVALERDELLALQRKRQQLADRITARRWTLTGPGEIRDAAAVDEIRAAAHEHGAALVTFVESAHALHAVVSAGTLRLIPLGASAPVVERIRRIRADLDVLSQATLSDAMRAVVLASLTRSLTDLEGTLVRPLEVDGHRLVLVSTGTLGQIPWGSMPSLRGVPVVVAPSATAWLTSAKASRRRRGTVHAFAGPGIPTGDREANGVAGVWSSSDAYTGTHADRRTFTKALASASIVHVAAHGVHQTENAMFSSLRLADGLLFAHELDESRRTAEHAVLSACELGLTTVRPGDEALGLTSVLLRLGTRCVVSGVARVGDELAAETMIDYHRRLAAGSDSAAALADAVAAAPGPTPFVCFGSAWTA
jgi:tetratricopeptide (TPR) repeat protein